MKTLVYIAGHFNHDILFHIIGKTNEQYFRVVRMLATSMVFSGTRILLFFTLIDNISRQISKLQLSCSVRWCLPICSFEITETDFKIAIWQQWKSKAPSPPLFVPCFCKSTKCFLKTLGMITLFCICMTLSVRCASGVHRKFHII